MTSEYMDLQSNLEMTVRGNDSYYYSANTDTVSSLQFDKRIKSRCYRSQFTLNDEVLVAVERREEYRPIENQVTIEVDICLGICDEEEAKNNHYIVRLNDMASQNAWVYRMINYDTFVDKDISNSIRDDAMEPNKLYLLKHKHTSRIEDALSYNEPFINKNSYKDKLKTTASQFNNPFDDSLNSCTHKNISIPYEKNVVLRNELLIHTGTPRYEFIKDRTYTSSFNIDLTKVNSFSNGSNSEFSSIKEINIPSQKKTKLNEDINGKSFTSLKYDQINVNFTPTLPVVETVGQVDKKEASSSNSEIIPFAEETDHEESSRIDTKNTLSKYLQYYLPSEKPKDEEFDIRSEVSTCIESSTETESVNGYFEQNLSFEKPFKSIAVLDEFNDFSPSEESSSAKENNDKIDGSFYNDTKLEKRDIPFFICDDSIHLEDIIYQENMVLEVENSSPVNSLSLHSPETLKQYACSEIGKVVAPKMKSITSTSYKNDLFLPVSVRRLQYEELNRHCSNIGLSTDHQPAKMKLITSDNYTDIIDIGRMNTMTTSTTENKENELDKESSISFSSGSMIVKDVLSEENMEYFISHNNLEALSSDRSDQNEMDNSLGQVEEESEYEDSEESGPVPSPRGSPENFEDESGSFVSEPEIDATSASSFTTSRNIDSITFKNLTKTPIECGTGKFEKFLEERERRKSEAPISSFPVSRDSLSSVSLSYVDSNTENYDRNQKSSDDRQIQNDIVNQVTTDRNSPLTSISRTSSISSSVFSASSDAPFDSNVVDTNTVMRKDRNGDTKKPPRSSSESSSSSKVNTDNNKEEMTVRKESIQLSKGGPTSSDWSSSSQDDDNGKETPKPEIISEPLKKEPEICKEVLKIPIESSIQKFERFLEERSRKENNFQGTQDTVSSSSDYRQNSSKTMILKHGDSIEDIEELLMQQKPSIHSQRSIPLRKQISTQNKNEMTNFKNDFLDQEDGLMSEVKNKPSAIRNSHSSSSGSSSSSDDESVNKQDRENNRKIAQLSSSSHTESTSNDEESGQVFQKSTKFVDKSKYLTAPAAISVKINSGNGRSSITSSSSSSDEESDSASCRSLDHRESIQSGKGGHSVEVPPRSKKIVRSMSESSSGTDDTSSSSSDQESSHKDTKVAGTSQPLSNTTDVNITINHHTAASRHSSSSTSCTLSSSSDEEPDHKKTASIDRREKFDYTKRGNSIEYRRKEPLPKQQSLNFVKTDQQNNLSIDHREKFNHLKPQRSFDLPRESNNVRRSSSSSCTLSSSSDEDQVVEDVQVPLSLECQRQTLITDQSATSDHSSMESDQVDYRSMDHREKFEEGPRPNTMEAPVKCQRKSLSERTPISNYEETNVSNKGATLESELDSYKSIDHREKFENPQRTNTIERQKKIDNRNSRHFSHSSTDSETISDSLEDVECAQNVTTDHTEICLEPEDENLPQFQENKEPISIDSIRIPRPYSRDFNSVERIEKFIYSSNPNTMESKRPIKTVSEPVSCHSSSETLSSSSDDEIPIAKRRTTDHREKLDDPQKRSLIQGYRSKSEHDMHNLSHGVTDKSIDHVEKFENSNRASTIERKKKVVEGSNGQNSPLEKDSCLGNYRSIDHQEKFDNPRGRNSIKHRRRNNVNESNNIYSSSDSETSVVSSDEELANDQSNQSIVHQEIIDQKSCVSDNSSKESVGKSTDHKDEQLSQRTTDNINKQRNTCNGKDTVSSNSSTSSYTKSSSSNKVISKEPCLSPEYVNIPPKLMNGADKEFGRPDSKMSTSELSYSTSSEDSVTFDKEKKADQSHRRYQTLPIKRPQNSNSMKEKSKSLDKPIEIRIGSMDSLSNRGSTVDMVEKKYHEYTETWSRNSPIDRKNGTQNFNLNLSKKSATESKKETPKRSIGPLTTRPRPFPSYMSPVNAYPCEESDLEFDSSDSVVNDYSADYRADEISTRNGSLQDFVKELSQSKLYKASPVAAASPKPVAFKSSVKSRPGLKPVNLNYGATEDVTDHSRPSTNRRISETSVTTDSSYLDQPTLAKRSTKISNLAKLDSLSSSNSTSSISAPRDKSTRPSVIRTVSVSSTSTSTFSDNSNQVVDNRQRTPSPPPPQAARTTNDQIYRERSHMLNGSNIYPVRSNDNIQRKVPSESESSEYSSTSDEESSSKEFLESALN